MKIAAAAFFWFSFVWNISFHSLTFSLHVSLRLKWVSCKQHVYWFCIYSVCTFCLKHLIPLHLKSLLIYMFLWIFLLLCFLPRTVPLAFIVKLVLWCWTLCGRRQGWDISRTTCMLSIVKQITSPGGMHETSARAWCTGKTQRNQVEREVGGGIGMGNTCKSMADSCQCMTKPTEMLWSN